MITLDKTKGILTLDGNSFDSSLTIAELKHAKQNLEVDLSIANAGWESYKASHVNNGEYILGFRFYEGKLESISYYMGPNYRHVSIPFEDWKNEKILSLLNGVLQYLGGNAEYSWGSVSLIRDNKGGGASVFIKYNNMGHDSNKM